MNTAWLPFNYFEIAILISKEYQNQLIVSSFQNLQI